MKVLIVEDDPSSREYLSDALRLQGCELAIAHDGLHGLELFEFNPPDMVLTDIRMPGMNGLELLQAVRGLNPDAVVVLMTAFGCEDYTLEALRLGASNYLNKPIRHKEIVGLVEKYRPIMEARTVTRAVAGLIARRTLTMFLENNIALVPKIADHLMAETGTHIEKMDRLGVHLGLVELLMNAIEHGNLGITYHEKSEALEQGQQRLIDLYNARRAQRIFASRRVKVDFWMDQQVGCEWVITDEGKGFDWNKVPDPVSPEYSYALHGRGIMLSKFQFNELESLAPGNAVRVRKSFEAEPQTA